MVRGCFTRLRRHHRLSSSAHFRDSFIFPPVLHLSLQDDEFVYQHTCEGYYPAFKSTMEKLGRFLVRY
jgi:hypothetical protein